MTATQATTVRPHKPAIRQFLRDRGRSLRWLAGEVPTDVGHLHRMLDGRRTMQPDTFYRIAAALQVDPAAIGEITIHGGCGDGGE